MEDIIIKDSLDRSGTGEILAYHPSPFEWDSKKHKRDTTIIKLKILLRALLLIPLIYLEYKIVVHNFNFVMNGI